MERAAILFKKGKPMLERESIVKEIIKSCEIIDYASIEKLVQCEGNFYEFNEDEFLKQAKNIFSRLKAQGIEKLIPSMEIIDLTFFKEEIVSFTHADTELQFSLLFDTDEGFVKSIGIKSNLD